MKKKSFILALSLLGALVLGGCGGTEPTEPPHTHEWNDPTWVWDGYTKATAHFVCKTDETHTHDEVATNNQIGRSTTEVTCETDGKEVYTAKVTFEGKEYSDTKTNVIEHPGHDENEYGFCSRCGEYMGEDLAFVIEDGLGSLMKQWGSLSAGVSVCFRAKATNGHGYHVENFEAQETWTEEDLLNDFKVFTLKNRVVTSYDYTIGEAAVEPTQLGDDGYLYFVLNPSVAKTDATITFVENHLYNEAGVCKHEGHHRGTAIPSTGEITGIKSDTLMTNQYYRFENAKELHKYSYGVGGDLALPDVTVYYVTDSYEAKVYDYTEKLPEGINALYIVIEFSTAVEDGSFEIHITEHNATHGFCETCQLPACEELSYEVPTDPLDIVEGTTYVYCFDDTSTHSFKFSTIDSTDVTIDGMFNAENSSFHLYAWYVYQGFIEIPATDHDTGYVAYELDEAAGDIEYVFFEFTAQVSATNARVVIGPIA